MITGSFIFDGLLKVLACGVIFFLGFRFGKSVGRDKGRLDAFKEFPTLDKTNKND